MSDIAANIKTLRKEKNLSQEQFAQQLHVTRQTVSAWERGLSRPGLETIQQIAQVLEAEPEQVLYGPEAGKKLKHRRVSYWPVLWVIPGWFVAWYTLGSLLSFGGNVGETYELMIGEILLAMLIVFCYCRLKDEIRNRAYYDQMLPQDEKTDLEE